MTLRRLRNANYWRAANQQTPARLTVQWTCVCLVVIARHAIATLHVLHRLQLADVVRSVIMRHMAASPCAKTSCVMNLPAAGHAAHFILDLQRLRTPLTRSLQLSCRSGECSSRTDMRRRTSLQQYTQESVHGRPMPWSNSCTCNACTKQRVVLLTWLQAVPQLKRPRRNRKERARVMAMAVASGGGRPFGAATARTTLAQHCAVHMSTTGTCLRSFACATAIVHQQALMSTCAVMPHPGSSLGRQRARDRHCACCQLAAWARSA